MKKIIPWIGFVCLLCAIQIIGKDKTIQKIGNRQDKFKYKVTGKDTLCVDPLIRLDIELENLDSMLKNIPMLNELEISDHIVRFKPKSIPLPPSVPRILATERKGIVKIGSDLIIGRNERVIGDIVVLGGDVTVYGSVEGGIVTIDGNVRLASTSNVTGDVVCIWGNTEIDPGSQIEGETTIINMGRIFKDAFHSPIWTAAIIVLRFFKILFFVLIALLIYTAFPTQTQRISHRLSEEYSKSLIVGLIGLLILPILFLLLLLTIVGIPLAILLLPLLVFGGFLMGGTAFSYVLGRFVQTRCRFHITSPLVFIIIGILILELPSLLNKFVQLFTPLFSWLFVVISIVIFIGAWIPGFGAVILTRFGIQPRSTDTKSKQ